MLTGGDKLVARLTKLSAKAGQRPTVRVGFLEGATYPTGEPVALIAAYQEFGTKSIPSRPFFRDMIKQKKASWGPAVANLMVVNQGDALKTLAMVGEGIAGQLRASIIALIAPPLSPVTLMLRSMRAQDPSLVVTGRTVAEAARRVAAGVALGTVSTKPLVDSGHLLQSVGYEVVP